jgi:hypothetical protein
VVNVIGYLLFGASTGIRKDWENRLNVDKMKIVSKEKNFLASI